MSLEGCNGSGCVIRPHLSLALYAKFYPYWYNYHSSATQSKPHLFSSFFQVRKHIQQKACGPTLQLCGYSARGLTWNKYSLDSWNQGVRICCPTPSWSLLLLRQMQQKGIYTCASAVQFAVYCLNTNSHIHQQVKLRCQDENWSSWNANTCSLPENTVSSCSQPCQSISLVLSNSHNFLLPSWCWGNGVKCSAW